MSVLKPRKRLVYFRLSEDEFQRVSSFCESSGARSISELARLAIQEFVNVAAGEEAALEGRLRDLERLLSQLNERLRELTCALQITGGVAKDDTATIELS